MFGATHLMDSGCGHVQGAAAVLPETPNSSATRAYDDSLRSDHVNTSGGITLAPETRWQKQWKDMQDKVPLAPALTLDCYMAHCGWRKFYFYSPRAALILKSLLG